MATRPGLFALLLTACAACATSPPSTVPPASLSLRPAESDDAESAEGHEPAVAKEPPAAPAPLAPPTPPADEPMLVLPTAADLQAKKLPDPHAPADLKQPPKDAQHTPTGLTSKVLVRGTGGERPSGDDTVAIRHTGWMENGVKFESSADSGQAVDYVLSRTIPGWAEGISTMVVGEKRRFWIPGRLAHGDEPRQYGLPYGPLVYDIELVAIKHPPRAPEVPDDLTSPPAAARRTPSGLVIHRLAEGTGKVHPGPRAVVEVNYSGWTMDGTMFDSSVARGQTATFPLNGVIKGWTEALGLMVVGEKARVWIPAKLAYGEKPSAGSPAGPLVFDIELVAIRGGSAK